MNRSRLPRKAYNMLCLLDKRGKVNWVSKVRRMLFENGFGYAWFNQGVGSKGVFLLSLRNRLIDNQWQNWHSNIEDSNRYIASHCICHCQ